MTARYCEVLVEDEPCERYVGEDTTDVGLVFYCTDEEGGHQYVALCQECFDILNELGVVLNGTKP